MLGGAVHLHDVQLAVHGDQAVEHMRDDGFQLGAFVLQFFDNILQTGIHRLQRAQQLVEFRIILQTEIDAGVPVNDGLCRVGELADGGDDAPRHDEGNIDRHNQQDAHQRGEQSPISIAEHRLGLGQAENAVPLPNGHCDLHLRQAAGEGNLLPRPGGNGADDVGLIEIIPRLSAGIIEHLAGEGYPRDAGAHQRGDVIQILFLLGRPCGVARGLHQLFAQRALLLLHRDANGEEGSNRHNPQYKNRRNNNDAPVHGFHASCSRSTKRYPTPLTVSI